MGMEKPVKVSKKNMVINESFFGDYSIALSEGLPLKELQDIDENAKEIIVDRLLLNLKKYDWRAVVGLGALKEKKAEFELIRLLNSFRSFWDKSFKINVAYALYEITLNPKYFYSIIQILDRSILSHVRAQAVELIKNITKNMSIKELLDGLNSDNKTERREFVKAIIDKTRKDNTPDTFKWLERIASNDKDVVNKCKEEIVGVLKNNQYL